MFNAVLVGVGALVLDVPLAGTIAAVTFVGAYIPYLGAWGAGAFSVLIALGGAGTDAAIGMIVIQLLANGILQQMIQPIAYGAALGIHPLAVLDVAGSVKSLHPRADVGGEQPEPHQPEVRIRERGACGPGACACERRRVGDRLGGQGRPTVPAGPVAGPGWSGGCPRDIGHTHGWYRRS